MDSLSKTNLIGKRNDFNEKDLLIVADEWNTSFSEYDIISNLYPIIPARLFKLINQYRSKQVNKRVKIIGSYSNGISAFFHQSPLLINETLGLYISKKDSFGKEKTSIYNFEEKRSNIPLFEINDTFSKIKDKVVYVLLVFIPPKELTLDEELELQKIRDKDLSYTKGVEEGWSLLVTGMDIENIVIIPGKCTRNDLVLRLSNTFWKKYKDFTFKFTDETIIMSKEY